MGYAPSEVFAQAYDEADLFEFLKKKNKATKPTTEDIENIKARLLSTFIPYALMEIANTAEQKPNTPKEADMQLET